MLFVVIFIALLILVIYLYNSLISKKNAVENAYGAIDAMLKKRYDLIPNLVDTVKGYMDYEQGVLEDITELRTQVINNSLSDNEELELNNKISEKLGGIIVAVENYPELKANENYLQLQRSLNEVESQIAAARRTYNAAVTSYNNAIEMFPSNIIANILDYQRKTVFVATGTEREGVSVREIMNK